MKTPAPAARASLWLAVALCLAACILIAALRFFPLEYNLASVSALALFAAGRLRSWWALALPLGIRLATDVALAAARPDYPLPFDDMWLVYLSYVLIFALGMRFARTENPVQLGALSLGGSVLFFLLTNFGSWLNVILLRTPIYPGLNDYEANLGGLLLCYERALPFYRGTLIGDLALAAALFGAYAVLIRVLVQPAPQTQEAAS
jgi:hypothetical protein